jgi:uncharacterized protein YdeI (YjbR/CyaY-like superfamily)
MFYPLSRAQWAKWLKKNFDKETKIWLVYAKKSSGKPGISYNDAVEEALRFGWIDSTVKRIDDNFYMQRFTPRRKGSSFSRANQERLRYLAKKKRLHPSVKKEAEEILKDKFNLPKDLLSVIKKDKEAWQHFKKFSDAYNRLRLAYIDDARLRPGEFKKRLNNFLSKTRAGKMIKGHGGIEKYY